MTKELVEIQKNKILCDSRIVAEKFGKQHKNVLQKIDKLRRDLENLTAENLATKKIKSPLLFEEKTYLSRGQTYKYVKMNKPAYTLLVMGFSGKKAFKTKFTFNDAFYQMEQILLRQSNLEWQREREQGKAIRIELTDEIKTFINYATKQGLCHQTGKRTSKQILYYNHKTSV
jgi:Rha family phage regulatory protein